MLVEQGGAGAGAASAGLAALGGTNSGRTFRFFTGKAVVPFGYVLSYPTFKYKYALATAPSSFDLAPLTQLLRAIGDRKGPRISLGWRKRRRRLHM